MGAGPDVDPAIFDAAVLAAVQRLIPVERVHAFLRNLDQEHRELVDPATPETSLQSQAHKIISQAGMLGLTRMSECARMLEDACRAGVAPAAALQRCRAAAEDIRLFALPAALLAAESAGAHISTKDSGLETAMQQMEEPLLGAEPACAVTPVSSN